MSATNRGAVRRTNDAYYTPDDLAAACVGTLRCADPSFVVEPSVGGGAFARAVLARWPKTHLAGYDIDPTAKGSHECSVFYAADFLRMAPKDPDLIIGNPPYREAEDHVAHAIANVRPGGYVGQLLRLAFMEGKKRVAFWREFGPWLTDVYVCADRPSFTGGGTDACAYGWFVWRSGRVEAPPRIHPGWTWRALPR